jgi:hypothetical protein
MLFQLIYNQKNNMQVITGNWSCVSRKYHHIRYLRESVMDIERKLQLIMRDDSLRSIYYTQSLFSIG